MKTAKEVLAVLFPSYQYYLDYANNWLKSRDPELISEAVELLPKLKERFPDAAPQIGQLLVLAQMELGDRPAAERTLVEVRREMSNPNEETLCRVGRLFRDKGDEYAAGAGQSPIHLEKAIWHYLRSLEWYQAAGDWRTGHYPLINVAELYLILASWDNARRDEYQTLSQTTANRLLELRPWKNTLPDDNIWHLATEAEAKWLAGEPAAAAVLYREAINQQNRQPFHCNSIRKGAERTLQAFERLNQPERIGPMGRLDDVFRVASKGEEP